MAGLVKAVVLGAAVALGVAMVIVLVDARWTECRRVHPGWYCAMQK